MAATNFTISATKLSQIQAIFKKITSNGTLMSAHKAKILMQRSNLPREILGKIWELADHDCDGSLTSDEFAIAMHLVSVCLGGGTPPAALPISLTPPLAPDATATAPAGSTWIVTNELKRKYDTYFASIDKDRDGFVSRDEVRPLFNTSNVPQPTLAHIWTLCDTENVGKLNREQFALAMYLIAKKVQGKEPPTKLTPQMIPPSCRNKMQQKQKQAVPLVPNKDPLVPLSVTAAAAPIKPGDYSAIKELVTLHGGVKQLGREKLQLKQELVEKKVAIQHKKSEIKSLESQLEQCLREQKELDTQKQLANQQKVQLHQQKSNIAKELEKLQQQYQMECTVVQQLKDQLSQQEKAIKEEELGLQKLHQQMKDIQEEEHQLKAQVDQSAAELKRVQEQVRSNQTNASLVSILKTARQYDSLAKTKQSVLELKEQHRSITANLALYPSTPAVDMAMLTPNDAASIQTLESAAVSHTTKQPARQDNSDPFQSFRSNPFLTVNNNFPTPRNDLSFDSFAGCDPFTTSTSTSTEFDGAFATNWDGKKLYPKSHLFSMNEEELGYIANAYDDGTINLRSFGDPYRARIELRLNQGAIVMHAFTLQEAKDCLHSLRQQMSSLKLVIHIDLTTLQLKYMEMNKQDVLKLCKVTIENFSCAPPKLKLEGVKSQVERSRRVLKKVLNSIESKSHSHTHGKYILMWKKYWQELNDQICQDKELYVEFTTSVSNDAITCKLTVVGDDVQKVESAIASIRKIDGSFKECIISTDVMGVKICKEGFKSGKVNISKDLIYHVEVTETSIVIISPYSMHVEVIHKTIEDFISLEKAKRKITKKVFSLKYSFLAKKLTSNWSRVQETAKSNKVLSISLVTNPCCGIEVKGNELAIKHAEPQILQHILNLENDVICSVIPVDYYSRPALTSPELLRLCKELENDFPVSLTVQAYPEVLSSYIAQPYSSSIMVELCNGSISLENSEVIVNFTDKNLTVSQELEAIIGQSAVIDCKHVIEQYGPLCLGQAVNFYNSKNPVVIHAIMPDWIDGNYGESDLIYDAVAESLKLAADCNITSVSLPFLSSIDKNMSVESLAAACLNAVHSFCKLSTCIEKIRFVVPINMSEKFKNQFTTSCFQEQVVGKKANNKFSNPDDINNLITSTSVETIWLWKDDGGTYYPYQAAENDILNQESAINSTCSLRVGKFAYKINFISMTQTNMRTSRVRSIKNITIDHTWLYKNDLQKWEQFPSQASIKIEILYVTGTHDTVVINGNECSYDFGDMTQLNLHNLRKTDIKRAAISVPSIETTDKQANNGESKVLVFGLPADTATPKEKIKDYIKSLIVVKGIDIPNKLVPLFDQHINQVQNDYRVEINLSDELSVTVVKYNVTGYKTYVQEATTAIYQILTSSSTPSVVQSFTKPIEWERQSDSIELKDVSQGSAEWKKILHHMQETIPSVNLVSIERIQNEFLWEKYCQHKERMGRKGPERVNEMELFHGTSSTPPEDIYRSEEGFDMRFSREGLWGQGNYFAESAQYSCGYAYTKRDPLQLHSNTYISRYGVRTSSSIKQIFLVKVLTGDSYASPSDKTLRMPPFKSSTSSEKVRYDTVNGMAHGSKIYITYSNDKAYPLYLISYTRNK